MTLMRKKRHYFACFDQYLKNHMAYWKFYAILELLR